MCIIIFVTTSVKDLAPDHYTVQSCLTFLKALIVHGLKIQTVFLL